MRPLLLHVQRIKRDGGLPVLHKGERMADYGGMPATTARPFMDDAPC